MVEVNAIIELVSLYTQFLAISFSIKVDWSVGWQKYIQLSKVFNMNFLSAFYGFYGIQFADYRVHHILVTNIAPLGIALVLLILFKSPIVVLWYVVTLSSVVVSIFGYYVYTMVEPQPMYKYMGLASVIVFVIMFLILVIQLIVNCCRKRTNYKLGMVDVESFDKIDVTVAIHVKSNAKQVRNFIVSIVLLFIGYTQFIFPFLIFGFLVLINCLLNCFTKGQQFTSDINTWCRKSSLKIVLILLGFIYIPITTDTLEMLFCKELKCKVNEVIDRGFPTALSFDLLSHSEQFGQCKPCLFDSMCTIGNQLCQQESDLRLISDPSFSCSSEIYKYFLPGSILMLAGFTIGVPFLFYKLVKIISKFLLQIRVSDKQGEDVWAVQSHLSNNSCSSMYKSFVMNWKYYKLVLMGYRLLVVLIFVFLSSLEYNIAASVCLFMAHVGALLFTIKSQPYASLSIQLLYYCIILVNIINCGLVITNASGIILQDSLIPFIVTLNAVLPILMYTLGYYVDRKRMKELRGSFSQEFDAETKKQHKGVHKFVNEDDLKKIKAMDMILNRKLLNIAVNYFIFLGFIATLAGSIGILGIASQSSRFNAMIDTRLHYDQIYKNELGSYTSWDQFMDNCCCMVAMGNKQKGIEHWKCINNKEFNYKLLVRKDMDLDGYDIREFCGRSFKFVDPPQLLENESHILYTQHGDYVKGISRELIMRTKHWNDEQMDKVLLYLW